jgi:NAD(P)-dependent dehydrogenase (short-subunit alcohol dehydrogenase family)
MTTKGKPLSGKIAVVAGATRGAGRGIATALGEAGATVYCTGRSISGSPGMKNRLETIHETAEIVTARGGRGIAVRVDHTVPGEVASLFERVGEFDILINDIWGGDDLVEWGKKLWETKLEDGLALIDRAIKTHIITSYHGLPRLRSGGLVVEITDGDAYYYRGHFFYDLVKTTVIRMAFALSQELKERGIPAIAVTPGFLRSEWMLDHFGVTEANWRDAAKKVKEFIASETPLFVGRCVAALAPTRTWPTRTDASSRRGTWPRNTASMTPTARGPTSCDGSGRTCRKWRPAGRRPTTASTRTGERCHTGCRGDASQQPS